jgi:hypothetical protein
MPVPVDKRLGAEELNRRIQFGLDVFEDRYREVIHQAMQDGYLVGTEPPSKRLEYFTLTAQLPELTKDTQSPDEIVALVAQQQLLRWSELHQELANERETKTEEG